MVALVLGSTYAIHATEHFPAGFVLDISGALDTSDAENVARIVNTARAVAVHSQLVYSETDDADTFFFSSDDTEQASVAQGWADDAQTIGGELGDVVTGA